MKEGKLRFDNKEYTFFFRLDQSQIALHLASRGLWIKPLQDRIWYLYFTKISVMWGPGSEELVVVKYYTGVVPRLRLQNRGLVSQQVWHDKDPSVLICCKRQALNFEAFNRWWQFYIHVCKWNIFVCDTIYMYAIYDQSINQFINQNRWKTCMKYLYDYIFFIKLHNDSLIIDNLISLIRKGIKNWIIVHIANATFE